MPKADLNVSMMLSRDWNCATFPSRTARLRENSSLLMTVMVSPFKCGALLGPTRFRFQSRSPLAKGVGPYPRALVVGEGGNGARKSDLVQAIVGIPVRSPSRFRIGFSP